MDSVTCETTHHVIFFSLYLFRVFVTDKKKSVQWFYLVEMDSICSAS